MSITDRLNEYVKDKYGDKHGYKSLFGKDIGASSSQVTQLLNGERIPGNKIQDKLRQLGCDVEWLMTGRKMVTVGDKTVAVYPREHIEELGGNSVSLESVAIIEELRTQVNLLNKYNEELKNEIINKNAELMDKKKIIALLEDKILTMGTAALGNENSNMQTPLQVLQKIK